jgi:KaiC/GvpD/RAD55 family RecA-like ATPase
VQSPLDAKSRIVDVPISGKPKKRSTGIIGLDLLLDGGFPVGSIIMLYGTPVSGIELAAQQFWKVEGEEGTYLMNDGDVETGMTDALESHPEMYFPLMAGGRIVVDSLSALILKYGIDSVLKFLRLARDEMRKRNANMVFIVYTDIHTPIDMTRIMRSADIVIELTSQKSQSDMERLLCVHKMRDSPVPERILGFKITEKGIEATTTSRVV